jgi:hypothetical protein
MEDFEENMGLGHKTATSVSRGSDTKRLKKRRLLPCILSRVKRSWLIAEAVRNKIY